MRDDTATPQLRPAPTWSWNVSGAYVEVSKTATDHWQVYVSEGGCTDVWDIVWEGEAKGFRSIGNPNGDSTQDSTHGGFWNLTSFICTEYEPCDEVGRLP